MGFIPPASSTSCRCLQTASWLPRRRSVIVGAGYIAVEIAGILSTLGSKSSLLIRHDKVLPPPGPRLSQPSPARRALLAGSSW